MLEHEIARGRWKAGAQIPSEPDLCTAFGVSRSVVRQALQRLEQEGFIVRRKGHGGPVQEAFWAQLTGGETPASGTISTDGRDKS